MLKRIIAWSVVLSAVFTIATQPASAAHFVREAYSGLYSAANDMNHFVNSL